MNTIVVDADCVRIPSSVTDLESFLSWVHSDEFPEKVPVSFLNGEVWVDTSREQFSTQPDQRAYIVAPADDGWLRSAVFGLSFRITQGVDALGLPRFRLEHR
jgi:hypothetical protein